MDLVARLLSAELGKAWGQQVIVDNRSGASGSIGTEIAKNAAPDGYTLLVNTLPFVTNQFVYSTMPYDAITDFAPISVVSSLASLLVVHPSLPVRSVRELVAFAKSKPPGAISYGTAGAATNPRALINQINDAVRRNLRTPEAMQRWRERGVEVVATTPEEATAFLKKEVEKWRVVFRERGMKAEWCRRESVRASGREIDCRSLQKLAQELTPIRLG